MPGARTLDLPNPEGVQAGFGVAGDWLDLLGRARPAPVSVVVLSDALEEAGLPVGEGLLEDEPGAARASSLRRRTCPKPCLCLSCLYLAN